MPNVDFPDDETIAVVKKDLDVVILGDTLVESCAGGLDAVASKDDTSTDRNGMAALCHRRFRKENGGQINGIALGASDDRVREQISPLVRSFISSDSAILTISCPC